MVVALLAGGTGGAKLACGLRDVLQASGDDSQATNPLQVIANTGDDIEIYDAYVSPDPDLITYRLAGVIGPRGFGIAGESNNEMDRRRSGGEDVWFELGDHDLAVCRLRREAIERGASLTEAHAHATAEFDIGKATVLPMSDRPVRTEIYSNGAWRGLQEYMILDRCEPPIDSLRFAGSENTPPTTEVADALAAADLIVIGPSNPVISIDPILELSGMRELLGEVRAPVLAVSPFVGGKVVKGPTLKFMAAAGSAAGVTGVASHYGGVADAMIADQPVIGMPHRIAEMSMSDAGQQRRLATEVIEYGQLLADLSWR